MTSRSDDFDHCDRLERSEWKRWSDHRKKKIEDEDLYRHLEYLRETWGYEGFFHMEDKTQVAQLMRATSLLRVHRFDYNALTLGQMRHLFVSEEAQKFLKDAVPELPMRKLQ